MVQEEFTLAKACAKLNGQIPTSFSKKRHKIKIRIRDFKRNMYERTGNLA